MSEVSALPVSPPNPGGGPTHAADGAEVQVDASFEGVIPAGTRRPDRDIGTMIGVDVTHPRNAGPEMCLALFAVGAPGRLPGEALSDPRKPRPAAVERMLSKLGAPTDLVTSVTVDVSRRRYRETEVGVVLIAVCRPRRGRAQPLWASVGTRTLVPHRHCRRQRTAHPPRRRHNRRH